jgi:hypothetical protein
LKRIDILGIVWWNSLSATLYNIIYSLDIILAHFKNKNFITGPNCK